MTAKMEVIESGIAKQTRAVLWALSLVALLAGGAAAQSADAGYSISKRAGWDTHEGELWGAAIGCVGGGIAVGASTLSAGAGVGCAAGGAVGAA